MAKFVTIKSEAELKDEYGKNRDSRFYEQHAAKSGTPSKKIDWMVDHLERIIPVLQTQTELERMVKC